MLNKAIQYRENGEISGITLFDTTTQSAPKVERQIIVPGELNVASDTHKVNVKTGKLVSLKISEPEEPPVE